MKSPFRAQHLNLSRPRPPPRPRDGTQVGLAQEGAERDKSIGCQTILQTADKMGNTCVQGGADIRVGCSTPGVQATMQDQADGTYLLTWMTTKAGTFEATIKIGDTQIIGSPFPIQLSSCSPDLSKSELRGEGLKTAIAGKPATITINFFDMYENTTVPSDAFLFGLCMLKEKEKLTPAAKAYPFEGSWIDKALGVYELSYIAEQAGTTELHVWCDPSAKGERIPLPGSPFPVHCYSGVATAKVSQVDGWTKEAKALDKHGKAVQTDSSKIVAGDFIVVRPMVLDAFSNAATLPDGALNIWAVDPKGREEPLSFSQQSRGGVTTYDVRFECIHRGSHNIHVCLGNDPIKGSPVGFDVLAAGAEPSNCRLVMPTTDVLYSNVAHSILLETFDKFNNPLNFGGLATNVRLQLVKQSMHDQTMLMPNNHTINTVDNGDGTYCVEIMLIKIAANIKVIVNMDKNIPAAGGELPAVLLSIVKEEAPADAGKGSPEPASGSLAFAIDAQDDAPPASERSGTPGTLKRFATSYF